MTSLGTKFMRWWTNDPEWLTDEARLEKVKRALEAQWAQERKDRKELEELKKQEMEQRHKEYLEQQQKYKLEHPEEVEEQRKQAEKETARKEHITAVLRLATSDYLAGGQIHPPKTRQMHEMEREQDAIARREIEERIKLETMRRR